MSEVTRRFWISLAAGAVVGAGAVLGFAPYVRSQLEQRAARYGAQVSVGQVMPAIAGVRLRGVEVTLRGVPGMRVWIDDVVVGWRDWRPVAIRGAKIVALGSMTALLSAADKWQREHLVRGTAGGSATAVGLSGFAFEWKSDAGESAERMHVDDLGVWRENGRYAIHAGAVRAELAALSVAIDGARIVFSRGDSGPRIHELASRALTIEYRTELAPPSADTEPARAPSHGELAARRFYQRMALLGARLDEVVAKDAHVDIRGARARLLVRGQQLSSGPGTFELGREPQALLLSLSPDLAQARASGKHAPDPLTFRASIPLAPREQPSVAPLSAELRGGPVWLSQLGLKDGDFGLRNVSQASLESDARFELSADGSTVSVDGGGRLRALAIHDPRLAKDTVEGLSVAWRGKIQAKLDGSEIRVTDTELDLGALKLLLRGHYRRTLAGGYRATPPPGGGEAQAPLPSPLGGGVSPEASAVDLHFEMPLTTCQAAFDSLPKALVHKLHGMRFAGSFAVSGHARFDTADLPKSYDVDWDGAMSCRITEAPEDVRAVHFKKPFRKLVYAPEGQERWATFGPGTDGWVPLGSITRFMETGALTCEDGRFHRHHGFDKEAIINSLRENLLAGRFKRGASTISMQLAKNLYLSREKTVARKLQEALLTLYLEQELTKSEMLELYFNVIEYGPMIYGIGPAAQHYFHSGPSSLSLGQGLYLASILQQPKKQHFGSDGAVTPRHMSYLHRLMRIAHKIHLVNDDELALGLRETVVFGQPQPTLSPATDPYEESAAAEGI